MWRVEVGCSWKCGIVDRLELLASSVDAHVIANLDLLNQLLEAGIVLYLKARCILSLYLRKTSDK